MPWAAMRSTLVAPNFEHPPGGLGALKARSTEASTSVLQVTAACIWAGESNSRLSKTVPHGHRPLHAGFIFGFSGAGRVDSVAWWLASSA